MQIKTLLHSKGFALSPVLKVKVSGTRKWPIHQAKKSVGQVCLARALNIHIRIRQNTHSNRAIGKTIRFVKELSNLVPRALFPGFGGGAPRPQSQGKAPWGRG